MVNGDYVATGKTATTDANGNYKFEGLLPGTYRVVETQPDGYLSVGDTPGTVDGATRGVVTTVDVLSGINLDGGDDSIHNDFAETLPAELSGYVYHDANNNGVMDPARKASRRCIWWSRGFPTIRKSTPTRSPTALGRSRA